MTGGANPPVPRWKVLGALVLLFAVLGGIVALTEALRYPHASSAAATAPVEDPEPPADPRVIVNCGAALPREGLPRPPQSGSAVSGVVTSSQLYDCPQQYDQREVRYRGEVVGAVLRRTGGAWVQLNDDIYSNAAVGPLPAHRDFRGGNAGVGVFISSQVANSIEAVGGPTMRGDILDVVGTFRRVDPISNEITVIRATSTTRTPGGPLERESLPARRAVAIVLALLAGAVVLFERRAARASA